jgi:hypothetical protein
MPSELTQARGLFIFSVNTGSSSWLMEFIDAGGRRIPPSVCRGFCFKTLCIAARQLAFLQLDPRSGANEGVMDIPWQRVPFLLASNYQDCVSIQNL